jgi:TRAP-type uncharacterized transport system fused permease subunit
MREAVGGYNWVLFLPIVVMILLMMILMWDPMAACYVATGILILICVFRRRDRLNVTKVTKALESSSVSMIDIAPITAVAGIIVGSITLTGLGLNLSSLLVNLAGGSLLALSILTFLAIRLMGMGVSAIATYVMMAVLVAPALVQMGVPPLVAHFFIFYVGVSMFIEPPFCPAAYAASVVAQAPNPLMVGFQAMRLSIVAYLVPFISIFQPALLGVGTPFEIGIAVVTSIPAVYALSVGFEGYCLAPIGWLERPLWMIVGFLLMVPSLPTALPGTMFFLVLFGSQWYKRKLKLKQAIG